MVIGLPPILLAVEKDHQPFQATAAETELFDLNNDAYDFPEVTLWSDRLNKE